MLDEFGVGFAVGEAEAFKVQLTERFQGLRFQFDAVEGECGEAFETMQDGEAERGDFRVGKVESFQVSEELEAVEVGIGDRGAGQVESSETRRLGEIFPDGRRDFFPGEGDPVGVSLGINADFGSQMEKFFDGILLSAVGAA